MRNTALVTLSGAGLSGPMPIGQPVTGAQPAIPNPPLLPALIVTLSAGASLVFNIEVTGVQSQGTNGGVYPASEPWNQADSATALSASVNYEFSGAIMACRINITSWTSGTLTVALVQP